MARKGLDEISSETSPPLFVNSLCTYAMHTQTWLKQLPTPGHTLGLYRFQPFSLSFSERVPFKICNIFSSFEKRSHNQLPFRKFSTSVYPQCPHHLSHSSPRPRKLSPKLCLLFIFSAFTQPLIPCVSVIYTTLMTSARNTKPSTPWELENAGVELNCQAMFLLISLSCEWMIVL